MKKNYIIPCTDIVRVGTSAETMDGNGTIGFPVSNDFVDDEAAKGINDVVDDDKDMEKTEWNDNIINITED